MDWWEKFPQSSQPTMQQIEQVLDNPLFMALCQHIEQSYGVAPKLTYSKCSLAAGWNVKYQKSSRAICTIYPGFPGQGQFTCMVSVGSKEETAVELILTNCSEYVKEVYAKSQPSKMGRWLMITIGDEAVLEDAKKLMALRMEKKR